MLLKTIAKRGEFICKSRWLILSGLGKALKKRRKKNSKSFAENKKPPIFAVAKRKNAEIAQLVEHNLAPGDKPPTLARGAKQKGTQNVLKCGNSSVGRAQPCQGWGREFESRFPLNTLWIRRLIKIIHLRK